MSSAVVAGLRSPKERIEAEIKRSIEALHRPGDVFEIRALKVKEGRGFKANYSCYFDDSAFAAKEAAKYSGKAEGIYITMNPVNPALLARRNSGLAKADRGVATSDKDILRRRHILIDCDATRPAGISSNESEKLAAESLADEIAADLQKRGFPECLRTDSGNGVHLYLPVDLPADEGGLVKRFLEALSERFSNESAKVDTTVHNPARITKACGTQVCKGESTKDRPHRYARILKEAPWEPASRELLEEFAGESEAQKKPPPATVRGDFDLQAWVAERIPAAKGPNPWSKGPLGWEFDCPENEDHAGKAFVGRRDDGVLVAICHHDSCNWGWRDLRARYEPGCYDRGDTSDTCDTSNQVSNKGPGASQLMLEIVEARCELFSSPEGRSYALLREGDHTETHGVDSGQFKRWLSGAYYRKHGKPPSSASIADAMTTIGALCQFEGDEREVFLRIAQHEDSIFVDLGRSDWAMVRIHSEGWEVVPDAPVPFRRPSAMRSLPIPVETDLTLDRLLSRHLTAEDDDLKLIIAWMVSAFRPHSPYPLLNLHGFNGSGKSSQARIIRSLVDPNASPLRGEPRKAHDLAVAANNAHVLAFDNLSRIPQWLSDHLCTLATGGGFSARALYTNDDEVIMDAIRPVIVTGIEEVITRPDLLERAITVTLPPIREENRMTEKEVWAAFDEDAPEILGGLFSAVACAMRRLPGVDPKGLPRMADFAKWSTAAEEFLGYEPETILRAFKAKQGDSLEVALDASPIGAPIRSFMKERLRWKGTSKDLLYELSEVAGEAKGRDWPESPQKLSGELTRLVPFLEETGIGVERPQHRTREGRLWVLKRKQV